MRILGIETTCDETAIAIVDDGVNVVISKVASQIDVHKQYGGVVPEVASRLHLEMLPIVLDQVFQESGVSISSIDAVAIAALPGLAPALATGFAYASGLATNLDVPLIKVNHLHSHVWANFLDNKVNYLDLIGKNVICLLVSGGHTQLIRLMIEDRSLTFNIVGETQDDAAGEAFDKFAKMINLPYPGGPNVEIFASLGEYKYSDLPKPMLDQDNLNFSFSGLKSHIYRMLQDDPQILESIQSRYDLSHSFQRTISDVLIAKSMKAIELYNAEYLLLAGGVVANKYIRNSFEQMCDTRGLKFSAPDFKYCTDNAAMIAGLGYIKSMEI